MATNYKASWPSDPAVTFCSLKKFKRKLIRARGRTELTDKNSLNITAFSRSHLSSKPSLPELYAYSEHTSRSSECLCIFIKYNGPILNISANIKEIKPFC